MPRKNTTYGLKPDSDSLVSQEFDNLDTTKQDLQHKLFTREPAVREVAEGQFVLALVGSEKRMYTKVEGKLHHVVLTLS